MMSMLDKVKKWLYDNNENIRIRQQYKEYLQAKAEDDYFPKVLSSADCSEGYICVDGECTPASVLGAATTINGSGIRYGTYTNPNSTYTIGTRYGSGATWTPYYVDSKDYKFEVAYPKQFVRDKNLGVISYDGALASFDDFYECILEDIRQRNEKHNNQTVKPAGVNQVTSDVYISFPNQEGRSFRISDEQFFNKQELLKYLVHLSRKYNEFENLIPKDLDEYATRMAYSYIWNAIQNENNLYNLKRNIKSVKNKLPINRDTNLEDLLLPGLQNQSFGITVSDPYWVAPYWVGASTTSTVNDPSCEYTYTVDVPDINDVS